MPNGVCVLIAVTDGDVPELERGADPRWVTRDSRTVVRLADHLITNAAGYGTWHGAYLTDQHWLGYAGNGRLPCDPWGNRYAVNIACFAGDDGPEWDVVVICAGPDEEIDSKFAQRGFVAGGDDIVAVIRAARP